MRSSSSRWIASQIAYPCGLMTIAPRTDEFSASPARRTTSPYHAGKSADWLGNALVLIGILPRAGLARTCALLRRRLPAVVEVVAALRADAAGAPRPGRARTAA